MPPATPRAMITMAATTATVCHRLLPQAEAVVEKAASKASTPRLAIQAPVRASTAYFSSQPTTTE